MHGTLELKDRTIDIHWINSQGESKRSEEWAGSRAFTVLIEEVVTDGDHDAVAIVINGRDKDAELKLPLFGATTRWRVTYASSGDQSAVVSGPSVNLPALSIALLEPH